MFFTKRKKFDIALKRIKKTESDRLIEEGIVDIN